MWAGWGLLLRVIGHELWTSGGIQMHLEVGTSKEVRRVLLQLHVGYLSKEEMWTLGTVKFSHIRSFGRVETEYPIVTSSSEQRVRQFVDTESTID